MAYVPGTEQGPETRTVVLASDSFLFGDGLSSLLDDVPDIEVIGRAHDLKGLEPLVDEVNPQSVIISIRSQVVSTEATVAVAHRLRRTHPEMGIVVISDRADSFALDLLREGSAGIAFLLDEQLPGIDAVLDAVRGVESGQSVLSPLLVDSLVRRGDTEAIGELTPREMDVLQQMARGLSNRAIAEELHISVKAIEKGITAIFFKLGPFDTAAADRRVSAALVFLRVQADPFGPIVGSERTAPVVIVSNMEGVLTVIRPEAASAASLEYRDAIVIPEQQIVR